jgi:phospholipid/cholesterol/gamma-HCH transport system ATP-binding protein
VIQVQDLTIGFAHDTLLEGLDFEVEDGEIFLILGTSGSGKTTLLRYLIGLDEPWRGSIRIDGEPPGRYGRPRFGVMFQSGGLLSSLTLGENLALPLETWTDLDDDAIGVLVAARLDLMGLGGREGFLPAELSGGMRKRAGIARAMMLEPDLLFLDEPGSGLDPIHAAELDELVRTLNRTLGTTMVIATHELASIFAIGDRCILIDPETRGIIAHGDPRVLRDTSSDPRVHAFLTRSLRPRER